MNQEGPSCVAERDSYEVRIYIRRRKKIRGLRHGFKLDTEIGADGFVDALWKAAEESALPIAQSLDKVYENDG